MFKDLACADFDRSLHLTGVASLFENSFGRPFDERVWDWKYRPQMPRSAGKVRIADGQIQAFYGGTQREWRWHGSRLCGLQMGDVMVAPRERGRMRKMGTMAELCQALCLERISPVETLEEAAKTERPSFSFGFPSYRHFKIGERTGLYIRSGELLLARWPASDLRPSLLYALRPIETGALRDDLVNGLWQKMSADLGDRLLGVRSFEWLRWRYLAHPVHRYQLLTLTNRLTRRPMCLLVVRQRPEELEWVDYVGTSASLPHAIRALRRFAKVWGSPVLSTWIHQNMKLYFDSGEASFAPSGIIIPVNCLPEAAFPRKAGEALWLMPGDTDFR